MPIKGLTDQPRQFSEIGQLRKGAPKPKGKQQPGADLTYFRATFEDGEGKAADMFLQAYGSEPREINIRLPFNTVDENFDAWREAYVKGGLVHRCDGEYTQYEVNSRTGSILVMRGLDTDDNKVKCDGSTGCKPTGRLKVIIPELRRLAFMTVLTTSIWDVLNISRQLEAIRYINGGKLQNVPLILKRRPREISTPSGTGGKKARREMWLLSIEANPDWVEARVLALPSFDEPLQLPPGMPDMNGDEEIVEAELQPIDDIEETIIDAPQEETEPRPKAKTLLPIPTDSTQFYTQAKNELRIDAGDARELAENWLEEHHGSRNISAYTKNGGEDAWATLWEVLKQSV